MQGFTTISSILPKHKIRYVAQCCDVPIMKSNTSGSGGGVAFKLYRLSPNYQWWLVLNMVTTISITCFIIPVVAVILSNRRIRQKINNQFLLTLLCSHTFVNLDILIEAIIDWSVNGIG